MTVVNYQPFLVMLVGNCQHLSPPKGVTSFTHSYSQYDFNLLGNKNFVGIRKMSRLSSNDVTVRNQNREGNLIFEMLCMWWESINGGALGNVEYPFITITLAPLWLGVVAPNWVPSMDQIDLFDYLPVYKQMSDVKLNCKCYIGIFGTIKLCANE